MRTRTAAGLALALLLAAGALALDKPADPPAPAEGFLTVGKRYNFLTRDGKVNILAGEVLKQHEGKWARIEVPADPKIGTDYWGQIQATVWVRLEAFDLITETPPPAPDVKK